MVSSKSHFKFLSDILWW